LQYIERTNLSLVMTSILFKLTQERGAFHSPIFHYLGYATKWKSTKRDIRLHTYLVPVNVGTGLKAIGGGHLKGDLRYDQIMMAISWLFDTGVTLGTSERSTQVKKGVC